MHIKLLLLMSIFTISNTALAGGQHGSEIYHALYIEAATGSNDTSDAITEWDIDGWIGNDDNKLWLKAEGERENGESEAVETWLMYSRYYSTFWDIQIGLRYDTQPDNTNYAVLGLHGLAPYFFETDAHIFISEDGDLSARLSQHNEFLITQQWIVEPYLEANFFAQDVEALEVGAGLSSAEFGIQTRYEFTRQFAPFIDIKYERLFGETADIAQQHDGSRGAFIAQLGVKFLF